MLRGCVHGYFTAPEIHGASLCWHSALPLANVRRCARISAVPSGSWNHGSASRMARCQCVSAAAAPAACHLAKTKSPGDKKHKTKERQTL
ncbi:hypothetical protein AOLI_G00094870 [Acnodon oligacanthus]